jgi:hypothetical protein
VFLAIALGAAMTLHAVNGLDRTTEDFRRRLAATAVALDVDPTMLAAIISFETGGTFRADIRNPQSNAVGLIQFLPSTARNVLGVSANDLARMTPTEQLPHVARYLQTVARGRKLRTVSDFYAAVFAPNFIGAPDSTVLYRAPSKAYEWNKALDRNRSGTITKAEAAAPVVAIYRTALARGPLTEGAADTALPFRPGSEPPTTGPEAMTDDEKADTLPPDPRCVDPTALVEELDRIKGAIVERLDFIDLKLDRLLAIRDKGGERVARMFEAAAVVAREGDGDD